MTYINRFCADVGTVNCPCPLAETGDCLICSRLSGKEKCDCGWAGVCIYNEYIQNDGIIRNRRKNEVVPILKKIRYGEDIIVIVLKVSRGFALTAAQPGSFVFINSTNKSDFSNLPISVMKADVEKEQIWLALKIISGKTKAIAEEKDSLMLRGVYRSGILGEGTASLAEDVGIKKVQNREQSRRKKWLVITKGIGFAPAVNLLRWAGGRTDADIVIDTEKVGEEIIRDYLKTEEISSDKDEHISIEMASLQEAVNSFSRENRHGRGKLLLGKYSADFYDRVIIFTSDYYISVLAEAMDIPSHKIVFCNNFRMCCGEGICGACSHFCGKDKVDKMCKCREIDVMELCGYPDKKF